MPLAERTIASDGPSVGRTKVMIYAFSSFVLPYPATFRSHAFGVCFACRNGMDAISAVAIGGTLLTGGYGYVVGTVFGVLISERPRFNHV